MEDYTSAQIEGTILYFQREKCPEVEAKVGNRLFTYFVIPQEQNPSLLHFAFVCANSVTKEYFLGVSDKVPEEMRQYFMLHEYIEYLEIGLRTPGRCKKALEEELRFIPREMKKDYLVLRKTFFQDLVTFYAAKPKDEQKGINEFIKTRNYLDMLVT